MLEPVRAQVLDVADYLGETVRIRDMMLSEIPAVYIWERKWRSAAREDVLSSLGNSTRTLHGFIPPYHHIQISDAFPSLSLDKITAWQRSAAADGGWALALLEQEQRPLYIGISVNLRQRTRSHLRPGSLLRAYMEQAKIPVTGCQLRYYPLPAPAPVSWTEADDQEEGVEEVEGGPGRASIAQQLRLTEALLIRFGQPSLNRSQE